MIINPRRITAGLPTQRVDGSALVQENITLEAGYRLGDTWTVLAGEPDPTATREGNLVYFDISNADAPGDVPLMVGARTVEARPDIITEEFPNGIDLYSTWAEGGLVIYANPPAAPSPVSVTGVG